MADRHHSPRNRREYGLPPHKRASAFVWSRKGKLLHAVGPFSPSASGRAVQGLHDAIAAQFGYGVARVVCNAVCFPPFRIPPLYSVGTRARLNRLYQVIDTHGRFVAGEGFAGYGDDLAEADADDEVIDADDRYFVASDLPAASAPVEWLKASADLPPYCLLATADAAICLPPSGGYALFRFADGAWHLLHQDMPSCILGAKVAAVYPDWFDGLVPLVLGLPELDKLASVDARDALRLSLRAER